VFNAKHLNRVNDFKSPDFYAVFESSVFLFECKDKSAGEDMKSGEMNFDRIEAKTLHELYNKGGVSQLTSFISNWRNSHNAIPSDFPRFGTSMKIYPIVLISDSFYNLSKLNELLIKKYCEEDLPCMGESVCPPVIIHIDTLISRAVAFHNAPLFFGGLLSRYINDNHYKRCSFENFLSNGACKRDNVVDVEKLLGFSDVLPKS